MKNTKKDFPSNPPQKRKTLKKKDFKKETPKQRLQNKTPLKRKRVQKGSFIKSQTLVSEHIIQIHAIKPAVLELSA
ncbi:hypothetical protein B0X28_01695 [Helicobacter pylori]|nr:hypothetical protein B0X28_01695 [Helicobacter pylori]